MDLKHIESFLAVANAGRYVTAADQLYISQSALSKHIAHLEGELGVTLFKKTREGVVLTQAGWDFYSYARKALGDYRSLQNRLGAYRGEGSLIISVGTLPLSVEYGIADALGDYWMRHPATQIDVLERSQQGLLQALEHHKIDVAIARTDLVDLVKYVSFPIFNDELVFICPSGHPLAKKRSVALRELRGETFVLLEEKSDVTQIFVEACLEAGFHPDAPYHQARHSMVLRAVQRGMGVTALPLRLLAASDADDLTGIPFETPIVSQIGLIWSREMSQSDAMDDFVMSLGNRLSRIGLPMMREAAPSLRL